MPAKAGNNEIDNDIEQSALSEMVDVGDCVSSMETNKFLSGLKQADRAKEAQISLTNGQQTGFLLLPMESNTKLTQRHTEALSVLIQINPVHRKRLSD